MQLLQEGTGEAVEEPPSLINASVLLDSERPLTPRKKIPRVAFDHQKWNDWRWQMRNRIRTVPKLMSYFNRSDIPEEVQLAAIKFPLAITPYYASCIERFDPSDPIFLMSVPQVDELHDPDFLMDDPLEEDHDMAVPGLVHRYPDRALVISTTTCAMYCRHCTRKRVAGKRESSLSASALERIVSYLRRHPEVRDVIISGGDPLTLSTNTLERIIASLRSVPSIDIIRMGTRTPVVLPMRIDAELVAMLRKYQPLWINTHFNHPVEMTEEATSACARLVEAGIPVGNQSVLLKGVNDDPETMERLCRTLIKNRIRPYYLFQCDLVRGVEHFRTPLSRGIEIMEHLRGRISGIGIPTYVVDAPHGGGKIPVLPNYIISTSPTHTVLRNYEGVLVSYPEPYADRRQSNFIQAQAETVSDLLAGRISRLGPTSNSRYRRREKSSLKVLPCQGTSPSGGREADLALTIQELGVHRKATC